ncbi:migration and invasion enhancer 1-like [Siniperca chuatsi]|uniref:migration and invasion enhancer 1-like n=1 Tax=Siniperca chuatsi TaxID=119488 RepID=UPI001CE1BE47|nr:migration and invasion enhancer 1-like [Siniperca chuatsi]
MAGVVRQVPGVQVTGVKGRPDSFEVSVNGQLIYSKLNTGTFPVPEQVAEMVKQIVHGEKVEKTSKLMRLKSRCSYH